MISDEQRPFSTNTISLFSAQKRGSINYKYLTSLRVFASNSVKPVYHRAN